MQPSAGPPAEQLVYLGASGLAGAGRFLVLRLYVFAGRPARAVHPSAPQASASRVLAAA
ncbi:hypothetical protein ACOZDF_29725 [Streptomyces griseoincarnatus]